MKKIKLKISSKLKCKNLRKSAKNNKILKKTLAKKRPHWYNCRRVAAQRREVVDTPG